jgi:hypothetical protein
LEKERQRELEREKRYQLQKEEVEKAKFNNRWIDEMRRTHYNTF